MRHQFREVPNPPFSLITTPGGLLALLANSNHFFFLIAYLGSRKPEFNAYLPSISKVVLRQSHTTTNVTRSCQALADLLSTTRTSLRLFGLISMYAWMKGLVKAQRMSQGSFLHTTTILQCVALTTFQLPENVAFLTDQGVLPLAFLQRWARSATHVYRWAYRAWLAGLLLGLASYLGEVALEAEQSTRSSTTGECSSKQAHQVSKNVRARLCAATGWIPVATHCSLETGFPWFNAGILGACGLMADFGELQRLWADTGDKKED